MANTYMEAVSQMLRRGYFSNSYKFALLRSLSDFGSSPEGGQKISIDKLANKFIEYYWPLTLLFKLRQETDPTKPPIVMKEIKQVADALGLSPETKLETFRKKHPDQLENLIKTIADSSDGAFRDVIPRFHNIRGGGVKARLFDFDRNNYLQEGITINPKARSFLKDNHYTLDLLAIGGWVKFTEKYSSSPRLFEKIQGLKPDRGALNSYRKFFLSQGVKQCFYCSCPIGVKPEVDHVIPWSFVADDKVWNLVLACKKCNGSGGKSNRLPHVEFVMALIQRNDKIMANNPDKLPLKIKTDLAEWRGQRTELGKHIEILVGRCEADGFDRWGPSL